MKENQKKFEEVKQLNLPIGQYAITGSGPMGVRNLKKIGDIDIIIIFKLWKSLSEKYGIIDQKSVRKIVIVGTSIEIFYEHSFYNLPKETEEPSVSERIAQSEIIEGLPFESLKHVLYYKQRMGREKDLDDIKIIQDWQKEQNLK